MKKEINKPVKLPDVHAKKLSELQSHFKISARKAGCLIVALGGLETIPKKTRHFNSVDKREDVNNVFLPFTKEQFKKAQELAKNNGYDFTSWFKIKLDEAHNQFKSGTLNINENKLARRVMEE